MSKAGQVRAIRELGRSTLRTNGNSGRDLELLAGMATVFAGTLAYVSGGERHLPVSQINGAIKAACLAAIEVGLVEEVK